MNSQTTNTTAISHPASTGTRNLNIIHLFPDLLNLYGDRGNIECLRMRCKWRGIDVQVTEFNLDDRISLANAETSSCSAAVPTGSRRSSAHGCRK